MSDGLEITDAQLDAACRAFPRDWWIGRRPFMFTAEGLYEMRWRRDMRKALEAAIHQPAQEASDRERQALIVADLCQRAIRWECV